MQIAELAANDYKLPDGTTVDGFLFPYEHMGALLKHDMLLPLESSLGIKQKFTELLPYAQVGVVRLRGQGKGREGRGGQTNGIARGGLVLTACTMV